MKKRGIRWISLLAAIGLCAGMAAGCGDKGSGKSGGEKDFGGRTFKIGAWWDIAPVENRTEWDDAYLARIHEVEQTYNCKIEFVVVNDTNKNYVTSTLAGNPIVDVAVALSYDVLPGYILGDIAYPLSDLEAFDFSEYKWNKAVTELSTYDGKVYAMDVRNTDSIRYGVFYNKTIFQRQGLPDLQDLYKSGEWTWDKMLEVAKKVQWDANGDDEVDVYPLAGDNLMWNLIYSNGVNMVDRTSKAVKLTDLSDKKVVEALDFGAKLMKEVKVMPFETDNLFQWGACAMYLGEWWKSKAWYTKNGVRQMADNYSFVPFPKGASATEYVSYGREISPYFMPKTVKNPEDVAFVFNAIMSKTESDEQWADWLEMETEIYADDAQSVDNVRAIMEQDMVRINPLAGFKDLYAKMNEMFEKIANAELTTQVALEQYTSVFDNLVKDANNTDYSQQFKDQFADDLASVLSESSTFSKLDTAGMKAVVGYYDAASTSFDEQDAAAALDGKADTVLTLTRPQKANDMLKVTFDKEQALGKIVLTAGSADGAPGKLKVQTTVNGTDWKDVSTLKNETADGVTTIIFNNLTKCTGVLVQLTAGDDAKTWSVADLELYTAAK